MTRVKINYERLCEIVRKDGRSRMEISAAAGYCSKWLSQRMMKARDGAPCRMDVVKEMACILGCSVEELIEK